MNYAKLVGKYFYKDRANVYRAVAEAIGNTDDFKREYRAVYENIPCHLAQYGKELSAHRDDSAQHLTQDLRLNYPPEYHISENDVLNVTRGGEEWLLIAGTEFKYVTHNSCSVRRRKTSGRR